jgi:cell division septum initiation protein DivIVA
MARLDPDEINPARLPRNAMGGYKAGPTEELLRRAAWDYRELVEDTKMLSTMVGELQTRIAELEKQVAQPEQGSGEGGENAEELANKVLTTALLESARLESEAILSSARDRGREIESAAVRLAEDGKPDLAALYELRDRVRGEFRATLESFLALTEAANTHPADSPTPAGHTPDNVAPDSTADP